MEIFIQQIKILVDGRVSWDSRTTFNASTDKVGKSEPGRSVFQSILCFQFDTLTKETSSTGETSSPGIQNKQIWTGAIFIFSCGQK